MRMNGGTHAKKFRHPGTKWVAENENKKVYIRFLADRFREAAREAREMVDKAKGLISTTSPFEGHEAQLVSFLKQARSQYGQIVRFYEANHTMLNYF